MLVKNKLKTFEQFTVCFCWTTLVWTVSKAGCVRVLSRVRLSATPRTVILQALLSVGFSRQEYWNRLPFPSAGDLPNTGIKPASLESPAGGVRCFTPRATWGAQGIPFYSECLAQWLMWNIVSTKHMLDSYMNWKCWQALCPASPLELILQTPETQGLSPTPVFPVTRPPLPGLFLEPRKMRID